MIKISFNILNVLFLTIAIYFAVDAGYDVLRAKLNNPPSRDNASREIAPAQENTPRPSAYYKPITDRNLFHSKSVENQKEPEPKEVDLDTLKKTQLQLKLWGTVASAGNDSYAVIESDKERHQNLYRVGDTVSGASLKRILREKVILTVAGKDEILEIQKPVSQSAAPPFGNRPPMPAPGPAPAHPPDATPDDSAGAVSKRRITLQRAQIESAMGNIGQLMGEAKIEPNLTDGNPDGLLINDVKPNSLFRRMGLRNGDVITGVDGKTIETVDDALKLYENLKSSDGASVDIKRKGQNQTIEYKIK
ncbi:MAG: type II secretion system protein GspC [Pseudomonadota bacterium]